MTISELEARQWMDAMAAVVGLTIPAASRDGVAAQLMLNHRLVAPLLEFELPADDRRSPALAR
jgi:hypothetical protein